MKCTVALVRLVCLGLCLILFAGCDVRSAGDEPATGVGSTRGPSPSAIIEIKAAVPGPRRLQVLGHRQLSAAAGVRAVYVQLMREPRFGAGSGAYPRTVSLWLQVGTSGGARFGTTSIRAWFSTAYGRRSVAPAPCGSDTLPRLIGPDDEEVFGCLAYSLPAVPGRLQIRGEGPVDDPFAYYLRIS